MESEARRITKDILTDTPLDNDIIIEEKGFRAGVQWVLRQPKAPKEEVIE